MVAGDLVGTTTALEPVAILTVLPQAKVKNAGNDPTASLCDHDRSAPVSEESVTGLMLVQHDCKPVVTSAASGSTFLRTALPIALTVFVACYGLFSVSDFADPSSRYGLPVKVIGGVGW